MSHIAGRVPRSTWDFSPLVGHEGKGEKKTETIRRQQQAALKWELSRQHGSGAMPWLKLPRDEVKHRLTEFRCPVREISPAELANFIHAFSGTPEAASVALLRDPYSTSPDLSTNPVRAGETPAVLLIRWDDFRIEEIIPALKRWARDAAKSSTPVRRPRREDPMADLWALSAYRLADAGHGNRDIADKLNRLSKFRTKRSSFDAEGARKLVAEGAEIIKKARLLSAGAWTHHLLTRAAENSSKRIRAWALRESHLGNE